RLQKLKANRLRVHRTPTQIEYGANGAGAPESPANPSEMQTDRAHPATGPLQEVAPARPPRQAHSRFSPHHPNKNDAFQPVPQAKRKPSVRPTGRSRGHRN